MESSNNHGTWQHRRHTIRVAVWAKPAAASTAGYTYKAAWWSDHAGGVLRVNWTGSFPSSEKAVRCACKQIDREIARIAADAMLWTAIGYMQRDPTRDEVDQINRLAKQLLDNPKLKP